jgi:hypothetical protein
VLLWDSVLLLLPMQNTCNCVVLVPVHVNALMLLLLPHLASQQGPHSPSSCAVVGAQHSIAHDSTEVEPVLPPDLHRQPLDM